MSRAAAPPNPRTRAAVTAAYGVQGAGFAVVLTSIPGYKDRLGMGDDVVTLVVLGVCVCAGLGSALSGVVSARRGSRVVVVGGLLLAALGIAGAGAAPAWPLFFAALAVYGLALGSVDAAMNMQGIDVERAYGRSLLASFYAGNAAGGVLGALAVSGAALVGLGQPVALPLVAVVVAVAAVVLSPRLVPGRGALPDGAPAVVRTTSPEVSRTARDASATVPVPDDLGGAHGAAAPGARVAAGTIALLGVAMVAFPVADSAISSWSATFLRDVLAASAVVAPLGYAAYQATLIVSRLTGDRLVGRLGRVRVVRWGGALGALGFLAVAAAPGWPVAVLGLAVTGLGLGVVAPLAFSAAGDRAREAVAAARPTQTGALPTGPATGALPTGPAAGALPTGPAADARTAGGATTAVVPGPVGAAADGSVESVTDRAVARLNVFTYVGAVLGGVLTGVFATADQLRAGFAVLAVLAAVSAVLAGRFRPVAAAVDVSGATLAR